MIQEEIEEIDYSAFRYDEKRKTEKVAFSKENASSQNGKYDGKHGKKRGKIRRKGKDFSSGKNAKLLGAMLVLFCFSATLLCLDFLTGGYFLTPPQKVVAVLKKEFFALQTGCFDDYETATVFAGRSVTSGGGGYIYDDRCFRLFDCVYPSYKDAFTVAARTPDCEVFRLVASGFSAVGGEGAVYIDDAFATLYSVANSLDGEIFGAEEGRAQISELVSRLNGVSSSLPDCEIKEEILVAKGVCEQVAVSPTPSSVRRALTDIAVSYCRLAEELARKSTQNASA